MCVLRKSGKLRANPNSFTRVTKSYGKQWLNVHFRGALCSLAVPRSSESHFMPRVMRKKKYKVFSAECVSSYRSALCVCAICVHLTPKDVILSGRTTRLQDNFILKQRPALPVSFLLVLPNILFRITTDMKAVNGDL